MAVSLWIFLRDPVAPGKRMSRNARLCVYTFAVSAALAMATMEAAYILFFIFGSFIGLCVLAERVQGGQARVTTAIRSVPIEVWMYALATFVVLTILLYSTFLTNPQGVIDTTHSLLSAQRTDILGGLTYWLSQHGVARGGEPWFYYLLLVPLYEQFALVFAAAGVVWALVKRELFVTFLAYWFVVALAIYSWAGEKMPWLVLHPLLPAILLASTFAGHLLTRATPGWRCPPDVGLVLLLVMEAHSAQALAYADGANPTEMLIYVQSSNDVPLVAHEVTGLVSTLQRHSRGPLVQVDDADLQGWPFEWYFRNLPTGDVTYNSDFSRPRAPILLMLGPEESLYASRLRGRYVATKYIWNWWFPEDYKGLTFDDGKCGTAAAEVSCARGQPGTVFLRTGTPCLPSATVAGTNCSLIQDVPAINIFSALSASSTWQRLWDWFASRRPFGLRGTRQLYLFVRKDQVPRGSGSTGAPGTSSPLPRLDYHLVHRFRPPGVAGVSPVPRGVAVGPNGSIYIADSENHRIDVFSRTGRFVRTLEGQERQPGRFNANQSPMDVAISKSGDIYAANFWNHRIEEFGPSGQILHTWGQYGTSRRFGFFGPRSVAIEPDGDVVVADTGNRQIAVFSSSGRFLFRFGSPGGNFGQFEEPSSVAVASNGDIYVADFWNSRIQYFTSRGRYLGGWSMPNWLNGSYEEPYLTVLADGKIAATDPTAGAIDMFTATGKSVGAISNPSVTAPLGVAGTSNGKIVTSDFDSGDIFIIKRHTG